MKINALPVILLAALLLVCGVSPAGAVRDMSRHPYLGAILVDAATGEVLFEKNADARGYPASLVKLMVLQVLLDAIDNGKLSLDDPVTVTSASSTIGGSQVYLKDNEVFPVEELLYALMVKSANDAATALAIHYAGSKKAFVKLMNKKAREIGMHDTIFHSVHGLPPGWRQKPDVSTPRDIALLCRVLLKRPRVLKYTSTRVRAFRTEAKEPFIMRNHNPLLKTVKGCDGLKTGFFSAAGFSIAATARRGGRRVIAVVMGSKEQKFRDAEAKKLLERGLQQLAGAASGGDATGARTRSVKGK